MGNGFRDVARISVEDFLKDCDIEGKLLRCYKSVIIHNLKHIP